MDTKLALDLWLEALDAEGRSKETLSNYRRHTRSLPALMPEIEAVEGTLALRRWLAAYRAGHAPDSVRTIFVAAHSFFGWCVSEGLIAVSPMTKMRPPKVPENPRQAYSRGELKALFAYLSGQRTPVGLRNYAICGLLLDCGLRASELCRLDVGDVVDGAVLVRLSKSGRPRLAPMGQQAQRVLARYLSYGRPKLGPKGQALFISQRGMPFNRWGLAQILDRTGTAAGVGHLSSHRFRHTFCTSLLRQQVNLEAVRILGGWKGYDQVRRYGHLTAEDLRAVQLRASPLDAV